MNKNWQVKTEKYCLQKEKWPASGRHIMAQFNEDAILVYQAYNKEIAEYAVQNQKFGGPWSASRMTWIKTNFLWMMFRSNWAQKKNQDRILGLWLKRSSFERYVAMGMNEDHKEKGTVRLQWDPDHYPSGERHPFRKAIQLGVKNIPTFINGEDILLIQDLTELAHSQLSVVKSGKWDELVIPEEKVYSCNLITAEEDDNGSSSASSSSAATTTTTQSASVAPLQPLRVTLSYKGKQKVILLRGRDMRELTDLIFQKLKITPQSITLPTKEECTASKLKTLQQGTVLTIS